MRALGAVTAGWFGLMVGWLVLLRGPRILESDLLLQAGWAGLACGLALGVAWARGRLGSMDARTQLGGAIGGSVVLQILAVSLLWPALSDDVLRYRADGSAWWAGRSPYASTPAMLVAQGAVRADPLLPFQDVHALYLPTSQLAFIAVEGVDRTLNPEGRYALEAPASGHPWRTSLGALDAGGRAGVWRAAAGLGAVLTTAVLGLALRGRGMPPGLAVLFGWHPLVVVEAGGMGHQDTLGALMLIGCALALDRRAWTWAGVLTGLAVLVKPFGGVLAGVWVLRAKDGRSRLIFGGACVALAGLGMVLYERGDVGLRATAGLFAGTWEANGSLYALVRGFLPADGASVVVFKQGWRWASAVGVVGVGAGCVWRGMEPVRAARITLVAALLVAPVVYPWYVIWPLALAPLDRRLGWTLLVWSCTIPVSYGLWRTADWVLPGPLLAVEYVPVALALAVDAWADRSAPPEQTNV